MGDFNAEWLDLREPADHAARSSTLTELVARAVATEHELNVLDLAAGTGSNLRYLAERLAPRQSWLLVDRDDALLGQAPPRLTSWAERRGFARIDAGGGVLFRGDRVACRVMTSRVDLAPIDSVDDGVFDGRALVTASALLDLVSEAWLRALAGRCRDVGATALFALSYDGRIHCSPEEPEDGTIRDLANRHQQTDKGFGAALGPGAAAFAERCFAALGYRTRLESSGWALPPDASGLQQHLIEGWTEAAMAVVPAQAGSALDWRARRLAHVAAGRSRIVVGHQDLAAWLPRT